jgi:hypothetical protein
MYAAFVSKEPLAVPEIPNVLLSGEKGAETEFRLSPKGFVAS